MADDKVLLEKKFPSNSNNKKEPHKLTPVVQGESKPPGIFKRIKSSLISDDITNVKSYLFFDILLPAIKDTIADMAKAAIEMALYGDSGGKSKRGKSYYTSYSKYYEKDSHPHKSSAKEDIYGDEIMVKSVNDAIAAFDELNEAINVYGNASVSDAYDICKLPIPPWTNDNYGWMDPLPVDYSRIRYNGEWRYILNFPKPTIID